MRTGTASGAAGDSKDDETSAWLTEQNVLAPSECALTYAPPDFDGEADAFPYRTQFLVQSNDEDDASFLRRLHNLGFDSGNSAGGSSSDGGGSDEQRSADISAFQRDYGITVSGQLDDATKERLRSGHDDGVPPEQKGNVSG